ncbi:MAG: ribonuclease HI [Desulfobacterales bacterium]|nr:ribonuclease HI [Desulfobacterales bacterium]
MKDRSGWERMMFKGHKVWLHVDNDQQPVVRDNKVLIKYQLDQDHEYRVPGEAVKPIDPARLKKKSGVGRSSLTGKPKDLHDSFPPNTIEAYTDGASSGNPGPAGIGVVLRFGSREKEISKYIGISTNNIAELTAIEAALKAIHTTQIPVRLYTDSQYCYGLLSLGWRPKRNEKLVAAIKKLIGRFKNLKILKVAAHAGIDENERADRLARGAIRGRA